MATLSRAVASPFSYVVSPVEVISIGAFSGVLISPLIKPALARRVASSKTGFRMADAEGTVRTASCKAKTTGHGWRDRWQIRWISAPFIGSTLKSSAVANSFGVASLLLAD